MMQQREAWKFMANNLILVNNQPCLNLYNRPVPVVGAYDCLCELSNRGFISWQVKNNMIKKLQQEASRRKYSKRNLNDIWENNSVNGLINFCKKRANS